MCALRTATPHGLQGAADAMQQAVCVLGADLDDGRGAGAAGGDADPGWRGEHGAGAAGVGAFALGEARGDVEGAVQGADQVGAEPVGLRQRPVFGGHPPAQQQDGALADGVEEEQVGGAHGEAVQGQDAGFSRRAAPPAGRGRPSAAPRRPAPGRAAPPRPRWASRRGCAGPGRDRRYVRPRSPAAPAPRSARPRRAAPARAPREPRGDPFDQVGDESAAPGAPGGGPGGQRVGLGQRVQQFQGPGAADRVGDRADGLRVVQIAPGGGLDEQQVVPHEGGDHGGVAGVEPEPGGHVPGDGLACSPSGHRASPCRCRAAARRPAAGRGGAPGGSARRRVQRSRPGGGPRSRCGRGCAAGGSGPAPSPAAGG